MTFYVFCYYKKIEGVSSKNKGVSSKIEFILALIELVFDFDYCL